MELVRYTSQAINLNNKKKGIERKKKSVFICCKIKASRIKPIQSSRGMKRDSLAAYMPALRI